MKHLDTHNILTDAQHGLTEGRSCETQLVQTVNDFSKSLDDSEQMDVILLDFSKAFDKVAHHRLALKMQYYRIRGSTLDWISNFLTDR